jgi:hypothetical protein
MPRRQPWPALRRTRRIWDNAEVSEGVNAMFTAFSISQAAEPVAQASRTLSLGKCPLSVREAGGANRLLVDRRQ